jgi:serine-type D-Ala-D-Ala carboxypeptidase (penicillin-binding protein 5/6)
MRIASHTVVWLFAALGAADLGQSTRAGDAPTKTSEPRAAQKETAKSPRTLKEGDQGAAVERLQRLLNGRLDPSPALGVDGDFGPATRAAVTRFQRSRRLEPTGTADARTWEALGPATAPASDPEPPAPEVVNAGKPEKKPADPIDGPPFVTVKAWAVVDGKNGELLGGHDESKALDMASTTKIMTALVVLRTAKDTDGLDEMVTFTERADKTTGSTSGIRAGERLPVRELMYGLLLPSGNDASVALAEHFGSRLGPPAEGQEKDDSLDRFIAEMNRVAGELGLRETHFANTHGLTAAKHHTSARDLAKLARVALGEPVFAACVATSRRGCTVVDKDGKRRNVVWSNTNRLLGTEGDDGVKTGSTGAAGLCLVASGRRGADRLIVVVLGSGSAEARDADVRNLFRWGWLKRSHATP